MASINAYANLRAPNNIYHQPSSGLYQIGKSSRVLQESMTVYCDWQTCDVVVKYVIETEQALSATVDFMLPEKVNIAVKVGQNRVTVEKKSVQYGQDLREADREVMTFFDEKTTKLFKASFPLVVEKGQHEILINYRQPLSQEEKGYGYFSKGYYSGMFQYELWPLNEWQVSDSFQLNLEIQLKPEALPSGWDSLFDEPKIDCFTVTFHRCDAEQNTNQLCKTVIPLASVKNAEPLAIKEQLRAPLPDRLFCNISPK